MSLIRNDVKKIKWTLQQGDLRKICMGNHQEKKFDGSYLSEKGRYRILTCRYGYKVTDRTTRQRYLKIIQNLFLRINCNPLYPYL